MMINKGEYGYYYFLIMSGEGKQESSYQKYVRRRQDEMDNPRPPSEKEYISLSAKGKKEYLKYVRKSYEMMFFWMCFGGVIGYLNYTLSPNIKILRNRSNFSNIRMGLTVLPIALFSYHGIKFMTNYKRKGAR